MKKKCGKYLHGPVSYTSAKAWKSIPNQIEYYDQGAKPVKTKQTKQKYKRYKDNVSIGNKSVNSSTQTGPCKIQKYSLKSDLSRKQCFGGILIWIRYII